MPAPVLVLFQQLSMSESCSDGPADLGESIPDLSDSVPWDTDYVVESECDEGASNVVPSRPHARAKPPTQFPIRSGVAQTTVYTASRSTLNTENDWQADTAKHSEVVARTSMLSRPVPYSCA